MGKDVKGREAHEGEGKGGRGKEGAEVAITWRPEKDERDARKIGQERMLR